MLTDTTPAEPAQPRAALADYIRSRETFRTARVENAFRTVPRHLFLPDVDLEAAYAPRPLVTKRADDGTAVSSAWRPNLVAEMLELLQAQPGHRVLEIGAATGVQFGERCRSGPRVPIRSGAGIAGRGAVGVEGGAHRRAAVVAACRAHRARMPAERRHGHDRCHRRRRRAVLPSRPSHCHDHDRHRSEPAPRSGPLPARHQPIPPPAAVVVVTPLLPGSWLACSAN